MNVFDLLLIFIAVKLGWYSLTTDVGPAWSRRIDLLIAGYVIVRLLSRATEYAP